MIPPGGSQPQVHVEHEQERRAEGPAPQASSQRAWTQTFRSSPTEGKKELSPVNLGTCFQA